MGDPAVIRPDPSFVDMARNPVIVIPNFSIAMNPSSAFLLHFRPVVLFAICIFGFALPLQSKQEQAKTPMLRVVCVTALSGTEEYVVASRDKKGAWQEHQTLKLRSAFITPWLAVPRGELYLCVREARQLVSKCSFTYPEGVSRALLVLLPVADKDAYQAKVIDTAKQEFGKGGILVVNSSSIPGEVMLGKTRVETKPGEATVHKPSLEENGMFRLLVTYKDESGKVVTCHDSYLRGNDAGRDFLFLLPDPQLGLRVVTLPDFGPFE